MTKPHYESPDWLEWWVNPAKNGSVEPDSNDLKQTQEYIANTYTPETQQAIEIKVRPQIED